MAGSAKFATDEMKELAVTHANEINGGTTGPTGRYDEMIGAGSIPEELPCEAYGIWDTEGYLHAASSADQMNGWYFHVDAPADGLPYISTLTYEAQDPDGNTITVNEGELMAQFVQGNSKFFYINGERFTLGGERSPEAAGDSICYPVPCTGSPGRGAIATFDAQGTGASIHVYSTQPAVRTEERMGAASTGPAFPNAAVDPRGALADKLARHTGTGAHPFWVTGNSS